nr:hypothetical protein [Nitrospinaceae bacterium]NIR56185.1 hypothetical protein [Nitrospinaceae bacterium]NIS86641.1 hypothetical protein [Nitrospinaceae bacterium]NIT83474.1 hypothetical protein [Nitrospinaceae bacterium]NIU45679.1 hypothetical protein [Nitrospinaceae bacterium]
LRTMLIPRSRVGFQEAVAGITRMNDFLRQAAPEHGRLIEGMDRFLGFDDIHYGWFKSASAWTHVARTMTENLAPSSSAKITQGKMLRSYWEGVRRLAGSDMTGLKPLPAGYF